jgi:hypothetical protein
VKKIPIILAAILLIVSCGDANQQYVRKAIRVMDKQGLFAEGADWESAKAEALSAKPGSMEDAQELVRSAAKVAGGKHSFLQLAGDVVADATSEWPAPEVTLQEGGIPVISLPPFSGNHDEGVKYALANQPFPLPGGDHLVLTTGCDVARTGEVFCDDPIEPDALTDTPLEDALEWISNQ